jgi:hypothetical protein
MANRRRSAVAADDHQADGRRASRLDRQGQGATVEEYTIALSRKSLRRARPPSGRRTAWARHHRQEPSMRGVAKEAPGAYKDSTAVVEAAHVAGLSRKVVALEPVICIKG